MPVDVASDIDRHGKAGNMCGSGEDVGIEDRRPAAETLRADTEAVGFVDDFLFHFTAALLGAAA